MPRASVKSNLNCQGCGAHIITNGRLTCPRCSQSVEMASEPDVQIDEEGRWKCQKCHEHKRNPKTLAIRNEIKCRMCDAMNTMLQKEDTLEGMNETLKAKVNEFTLLAVSVMLRMNKKLAAVEGGQIFPGPDFKDDQYACEIDTSFLKYRWRVTLLIRHTRIETISLFCPRPGKCLNINAPPNNHALPDEEEEMIKSKNTDVNQLLRLSKENPHELLHQLTEALRKAVAEFDKDFQKAIESFPPIAKRLLEEKYRT